MICYLNGQYLPRANAAVGVEDRGFIFGDGVYEVWRVLNGRLFEMERHLARLTHGLHELRIAEPEIAKPQALQEIASRVLSGCELTDGEATFYLEVTRGAAPRTHHFPANTPSPTVFAMANRFVPPNDLRARGATAITVQDIRWLRCDIKTIQLLPNVLAKQDAAERGGIEAIMVRDGVVTEGSHTNVMAVFDGVLRTHPLTNLVLPGITRAVVISLAQSLGIAVAEEPFTEEELMRADEIFLVGTTTDVMPIVRVNDRAIGSGGPGDITKRLLAELRAYMDRAIAARRHASRTPGV
jgi:D-alanine transaminase